MAARYDIPPTSHVLLLPVLLTSYAEQGYEVICFLADVGQEEDWEAVRAKAVQIGATKMYVLKFPGHTR